MNQKAFTVIESLITMAMIAILSVALIPSFQSGRAQLSLDRSASKLAQDIRGIMEKAMSAQEHPGCGSSFDYRYGVYLKTETADSYILFADCNNNNSYQPSDSEIEIVFFEPGIQLFALSPASSGSSLVFIPPDPSVFITSGASSINIIIRSSQYPTKQRTININKVGLVDIN